MLSLGARHQLTASLTCAFESSSKSAHQARIQNVFEVAYYLTPNLLLFFANSKTTKMSLRQPLAQLTKRASSAQIYQCSNAAKSAASSWQRRPLATVRAVPPVTQDATSKRGPTAMVFMNMGGPSTTDEVYDFLSKLFVRLPSSHHIRRASVLTIYEHRQTATSSPSAASKTTSAP